MNSKLICNIFQSLQSKSNQSLGSCINLTLYTLYKQPFVAEKCKSSKCNRDKSSTMQL